ncbi:pyridoxal phosphate-dependent aminotransferase [Anaerotignum sp.]|uniref:pyridoxal phosphate-dependent aminotransferase n=1 Tax=Anaerotignum sp. TaxID=2039241 RepID=UPI00289A0C14|nr:pyridoxal phosphate-dependent aminotransferase [Anaerotignum sp.]
MIAEKMKELVSNSSAIRKMFEEGKQMAQIHGAENVCDFSLGNPNLAAPNTVNEALEAVIKDEDPVFLHGYMNNSGYEDVRNTVANSLNRRFQTNFTADSIVMTVGAAGGMNVAMRALLNPCDEVVVFAPFFGEYRCYVSNVEAKLVIVPPNAPSFIPDAKILANYITAKTKMVIINSPNNPTGVIYPESTIIEIAKVLEEKQKEYNTEIYIFADEPYRELVYDETVKPPFITKYYNNTIIGYSWSKSLSLPGERIGYLAVSENIADFKELMSALNVATRILGFVNAPSLQQRMIARCVDEVADLNFYKKNRDALYQGLSEIGYTCIKPDGAFYLWMKTPIENDNEFVDLAKKYLLLTVPGSAFGCKGYIRLSYCVSPETVQRSLPKFKMLLEEMKAL